jgi:hypothetical protein
MTAAAQPATEAAVDRYAPPTAGPGAGSSETIGGADAIRRAHAGAERGLHIVGLLFGIIGAVSTIRIVLTALEALHTWAPIEALRVALGLVGALLMTVGGFALAALRPYARVVFTAFVIVGVVTGIYDSVAVQGRFDASYAIPFAVWATTSTWLWLGRPRVVLSPAYEDVRRATPHLGKKTSAVAWLALIFVLLVLFVVVWNFFAADTAKPR